VIRASVVIPAAGVGQRFGAAKPKQFLDLAGVPILVRTLQAFQHTPCIEHIIIAASEDFHAVITKLCGDYAITKCSRLAKGGAERQHSIYNALQTAPVQESEVVLVHDAVRPFVKPEFISRIVDAANTHGSAIPGLVPKETIKEVDSDGRVHITHERSHLRSIQTPQGFRREILTASYDTAHKQGFLGTDDASVVEFAGNAVYVIDGAEENIKITTPLDFAVAEMLLRNAPTQ
jgi:2-C-methyl-D-erythritol 4-phosphate cytidylyltransferase